MVENKNVKNIKKNKNIKNHNPNDTKEMHFRGNKQHRIYNIGYMIINKTVETTMLNTTDQLKCWIIN